MLIFFYYTSGSKNPASNDLYNHSLLNTQHPCAMPWMYFIVRSQIKFLLSEKQTWKDTINFSVKREREYYFFVKRKIKYFLLDKHDLLFQFWFRTRRVTCYHDNMSNGPAEFHMTFCHFLEKSEKLANFFLQKEDTML